MRSLRSRLREPSPLVGTLITLDSEEAAAVLRHAGFSWFFIDLEHSPQLDLPAAQRIVEVLQPEAYTVVRVPEGSPTWIKRVLDTGCDGIIVPHVTGADEARRAVSAAKYPPQGTRSVGLTRAHGYGATFEEYLDTANDRIAVIAQIEEVSGVDAVEEILAVEGVDAAFVGPYDLSGSLGILGRLDDPALIAAVDRVRRACAAHGTPMGIFCPSAAAARQELQAGTTLIAVGSDTGHLTAGATALHTSLTDG